MSTENDDIEIVVEDAPSGAETINGHAPGDGQPEGGKTDDKLVSADEGIDALRKNLAASQAEAEAERSRRIAAERQAQEASAAEAKAKDAARGSDLDLVTNAITFTKSNQETLKGRLREARSTGDVDAEADILAEISANATRLVQLEQGKAEMEAAPKTEPRRAEPIIDPVEAVCARLSPRSAQWVRAHPEFARDQNKLNKMIAAHNIAVSDGIAPDSDEYFAEVEGILKVSRTPDVSKTAEGDSALSDASQGSGRRASPAPPPAAPPNRGSDGGGSGSGNGNRVTLTSTEREMARNMGMSDVDYARNKLALQREGKIQVH